MLDLDAIKQRNEERRKRYEDANMLRADPSIVVEQCGDIDAIVAEVERLLPMAKLGDALFDLAEAKAKFREAIATKSRGKP